MSKNIAQLSDEIRDRETEEYLNKTTIKDDFINKDELEIEEDELEIEEDELENYQED